MSNYVLRDATRANWPGVLPWRHESSRKGYPTREAAQERANRIIRHAAANGLGSPDLRVIRRDT